MVQQVVIQETVQPGGAAVTTVSDQTASVIELYVDLSACSDLDDAIQGLQDMSVRCVLRDPVEPVETIIPDIDLNLLRMISDYDYGYSKLASRTVGGTNFVVPIAVPLGCIYLHNGTKLDVEVRNAGKYPHPVQVAVSAENETMDNYFRYLITSDISETFTHVHRLWLLPGNDGITGNGTVQVRAGDKQGYSTYPLLWSRTVARGQLEDRGDLGVEDYFPIALCFENEQLDDTVYANWQGASSGSRILQIEHRVALDRVVSNEIRRATKLVSQISEMEMREPKRAAALREGGAIPSANQLAVAVEQKKRSVQLVASGNTLQAASLH